MLTWNYRVFREANGDYIIREVFYSQDGSIVGCTDNAVEPKGSSLEELARDMDWFKEALTLPVLTLADLPAEPIKKDRKLVQRDRVSHEQLMAELGLGIPSPSN